MFSPFKYVRPTTASEASAELRRLGDGAKLYAGGAELLVLMRQGVLEPEYLVDVKHIPSLNELEWDGRQVRLGAGLSHRKIEQDPNVRAHLPLLAAAESQVATIRIRNQGTLGGNLCFADPHADPGTALSVHDTSVTVASEGAQRQFPLDELILGPYEVALQPDELLVDVTVAPLPAGWGHAYLRLEQLHRPTLNVAVAADVDVGHIRAARLAVGCVGPRPARLPELEERIVGLTPEEAGRVFAEAQPYLRERLDPVDDLLGTSDYKVYSTAVLLRRAVAQAAANAGRGNGRS